MSHIVFWGGVFFLALLPAFLLFFFFAKNHLQMLALSL